MATWKSIARFLAGEASHDERVRIEQKLQTSPDRQRFVSLLRYFFSYRPVDFSVFQKEEWAKIVSRCIQENSNKSSFSFGFRIVPFIRIAASILIVIGIGVSAFYVIRNYTKESFYVLHPPVNTVQEVQLADGTKVSLNKNATLKISSQYGREFRRVKLQGEAFFDVQKNTLLPFEVEVGPVIVRVLGTSFNINSPSNGHGDVTVSVQEGKVSVKADRTPSLIRYLQPEQAVIYRRERGLGEIHEADLNVLAWKTGILRFRNTPLLKICASLSMYYSIDLQLKDSSLAALAVTTELNNLSSAEALDVLASTLDLKIVKSNGTFYIMQ
jgi:transmembrane sensor